MADINGGIYQLAPPLVISPGSGTYLQGQTVDLALALRSEEPMQSLQMSINGSAIGELFSQCALSGTLLAGGQSWRCPAVALAVLGAGEYRLTAEVTLASGHQLSAGVDWEILDHSEP